MAYTTFVDAATVVMAPFDKFVLRAHEIAGDVQPIVVLALTVLIMGKSMQLLLSNTPGTVVVEVFARAGRVVLCFSFALFAGASLIKFDGVIAETQFYLAELFTSESDHSKIYTWKHELDVFSAIDSAIDPFLTKLPELVKKTTDPKQQAANTHDVLGLLVISGATVTSFATLMFAASIALMVMYFRIALLVCLGLMPLFIIFLAFQATSRLFQSWLATTISYVFSAGIAAIPVGIAITQLERIGAQFAAAMTASQTGQAAGVDFITTPLLATLTMGMMGYMAVRLPPLISRLVGGFVSGASLGEGGQLLGGVKQNAAMSMNAMRGAGGSLARNSKGQFMSREQAASPFVALNQGIDRAAQSVMTAKNDWMAAYGVKSGGSSSASNRRAPQQSVADRQATARNPQAAGTGTAASTHAPPRAPTNALRGP